MLIAGEILELAYPHLRELVVLRCVSIHIYLCTIVIPDTERIFRSCKLHGKVCSRYSGAVNRIIALIRGILMVLRVASDRVQLPRTWRTQDIP